jgi:RNA polymerase sigma factor (sigma-70 family)
VLNKPDTAQQQFSLFVSEGEPRLSRALTAAYGREVGHEATRDALLYAWENWERISKMDNPVGFLYRVGQSRSRQYRRPPVLFPGQSSDDLPQIEPALPRALNGLSDKQRAALVLIHVEELTEREAAEAMGVSRATVRRHADRALEKLRKFLEVENDK